MDSDSKKRDGKGAQHPQANSGECAPAQVHGAEQNNDGPGQSERLKSKEHELPFHEVNFQSLRRGRSPPATSVTKKGNRFVA